MLRVAAAVGAVAHRAVLRVHARAERALAGLVTSFISRIHAISFEFT